MNAKDDGLLCIEDLQKFFLKWNFFFKKKNFYIRNIKIDSRSIEKNSLFIAISGKNNDGHNYIEDAISLGATCIICEKKVFDILNVNFFVEKKNICFIVVDNSLIALQDLARYKRQIMPNVKVIGITGNIGKTTTREMVKLAMKGFFKKVFTADNNHNNHIGLPLTIVNAPIDTECLILELGMNHIGEIDFLTKIARPDVAIITSISPVHMENFNDIHDIVNAKAEIFNGMKKEGNVILDKSSDFFSELVYLANKRGIKNIITIGKNDADICLNRYNFNDNFTTTYEILVNKRNIECNINGFVKHNIINSLFAFGVAKVFNFDMKKVSLNLSKFEIVQGRGNLERKNINGKNIFIINDCYNSSPFALKSSISTLTEIKKKFPALHAIAVIGDMLELGKYSRKYHLEIADFLIKNNINKVVCIGDESKTIFDKLPNNFDKYFFHETKDFVKKIINFIQNNDLILFKASHGMHFNCLIDELNKNSN